MHPHPILVVDDEPEMRLAMTQALHCSGYAVQSAASGPEALLKFKREKYSVVITDMKMPEMSGMEVLGEVKRLSPQVPVVMITAYGTINKAVAAMQQGASDFILKPFSSDTLEQVIRKVRPTAVSRCADRQIESFGTRKIKDKKIITGDQGMQSLLDLARSVAPSTASVLLQGESGTGKEMLASYIHHHSGRKNSPYIAINCAALPDNLAESELFGHEKGAFTGALSRKVGKFELAGNGTIVLDEVSEMPLALQTKLLRVLQEKEIDRIGGTRTIPIDCRVIAISNADIRQAVAGGSFREDLYYRLNVIPLTIPPLRRRKDDIPLLVDYFCEKYGDLNQKKITPPDRDTLDRLLQHPWKGNVRELENMVERAVLLTADGRIAVEHLFWEDAPGGKNDPQRVRAGMSVREMEKQLIFTTLAEVGDNRTHAAEMLGISIRTLRNKLREYKEN